MTDKDHQEIIDLIRRRGVPTRYKQTIMGNYKPSTVVQIIVDALNDYREVMKEDSDG